LLSLSEAFQVPAFSGASWQTDPPPFSYQCQSLSECALDPMQATCPGGPRYGLAAPPRILCEVLFNNRFTANMINPVFVVCIFIIDPAKPGVCLMVEVTGLRP